MRYHRIGLVLLLGAAACLWGLTWKAPAAGPYPPQAARAASGLADQFGNHLTTDTITNTGWVDARSGGVHIQFPDYPDDSVTPPVPLGFSFPFYENAYANLQIDTNGLVYFSPAASQNLNSPIPKVSPPNNFIAAYWSDLFIGATGVVTGEVYTLAQGSAPNRSFVIEWSRATRLQDISHPLTFELILHEDGRMVIQYQALTGNLADATVGIESADGLDGLQYAYNGPGLASGLSLHIDRPASAAFGVRAVSGFDGSLLAGRQGAASFAFKNIGAAPSDRFEIRYQAPADWNALVSSAGALLVDANNDGILETSSIPQGSPFTLTLRVSAPAVVQPGDFISIPITITSIGDPAHRAFSQARFAAPASFVYSFSDQNEFNSLGYLSTEVKKDVTLYTSLGRNHSLALSQGGLYFYGWDRSYTANGEVSNIEFAIFDASARVQKAFSSPFDHTKDNSTLQDTQPALAAAANGKIGILFLRHDSGPGGVNNVLFALLGPDGSLETAIPLNLTGQAGGGSLVFNAPRLAATSTGSLVAAWTVYDSTNFSKNIWTAEIDPQAGAVVSSRALTASTGSALTYDQPQLAALSAGRAALAYQENQVQVFTTRFLALDAHGLPEAGSGAALPGLSTAQQALAQFSPGGPLLFAWTGSTNSQVSYCLLNNAVTTAGPLQFIPQPDASRTLALGNLAAASDQAGRAIVTWMDIINMRRIYYALLNPDGSFATAPVILKDAGSQSWGTNTSRLNLAPFSGFFLQFFPAIHAR